MSDNLWYSRDILRARFALRDDAVVYTKIGVNILQMLTTTMHLNHFH